MTDETTDPGQDLLIGILSEQTGAIEEVTEIAGQVARNTEALIRQFTEHHGKRQAAEEAAQKARTKNDMTLALILKEVQRIGSRQTADREEIDSLKAIVLIQQSKPFNGNGNGGSHE